MREYFGFNLFMLYNMSQKFVNYNISIIFAHHQSFLTMKTKFLLALISCISICSLPAAGINSWELPEEGPTNFGEYLELVENGPDCSYSFEKDGIYYWISDEAAGTVMVVNEHKFFAREYCYKAEATIEYFVEGYDNPYKQSHIAIPPTVEHGGKMYTVTEICYNAFNGSDNLVSVTIPDTVNKLWLAAFSRCKNLANVSLSANIETLPISLFEYCPSLLRLDISHVKLIIEPSKVFGLGRQKPTAIEELVLQENPMEGYFFKDIASLKRLHLSLPEPPQCKVEFMDEVFANATLFVPDESVEKYKADARWGRFAHIAGESTGIAGITVDDKFFELAGNCIKATDTPVDVFGIDGRVAAHLDSGEACMLTNGLYLLRCGNKTAKVAL